MNKKKGIAILGSTGSIGTQAIQVIEEHKDLLQVSVLSAYTNEMLLIEQAIRLKPNSVVIADESKYKYVKDILFPLGIKVYAGDKSLSQIVELDEVDIVLNALVGFSGLYPSLAAIEAGKVLALANKESMVIAGEIVTEAAQRKASLILPVDSEHSAIFQCLQGEYSDTIEKVILTASGGPFLRYTAEELKSVTKKEALNHPNWSMGAKITIDSATMMNKGFEIIEAKWLFHLNTNQIEVLIHPQSLIHSIVQFIDGSVKAQLSLPDMRLPIQYALLYPDRFKNNFPRLNFLDYNSLSFEQPDLNAFPNLTLAYHCLEKKGNMACILNAANEISVHAFLNDKIKFTDIYNINLSCLEKISFISHPSLEDYKTTDKEARAYANTII